MKKIIIINTMLLLTVSIVFISACSNYQVKNEEETIKIGAILGLTGNSGSLGEDARNGLQLAIDEQNINGGLLGKKIELYVQDSKTEGKIGVSIVKNMLESTDNKPIAIYTQSSKVSMPVKPVAEKNQTIMFAISGAEQLLENSKYIFRNWPSPKTAAKVLVDFLVDTLAVKNLSIFYCNNDYGKSMQKYLTEGSNQKGITTNFSVPFNEKDGDYKSLITEYLISIKGSDCVYAVGLGSGLGILIKQIREAGYRGPILSDITAPYPNVLVAAGDASMGMYYLDYDYDNVTDSKSQKQYYQSFKSTYNKDPLNFSVISYEAMKLLFIAVENAQSFNADKVVSELNKIQNYSGVFGNTSVVNNEVIYSLDIKQVKL